MLLFATKLTEKIPDASNDKEYYKSFLKNKNQKLVKRSNTIITQQPKTIENPNIIDISSFTIEHLKTSRKLSKSIRQAEKVSQVSGADKNSTSPLYSETKKSEFFS